MTTTTRSLLIAASVVLATGCPPKPADPLPPPPAAKISSFTVTPASVPTPGDMVTLSWSTTDATSVSVEQVGVGPVSATGASGSATVAVQVNTIFVLTARGEGGTDARSVGVTVAGGTSTVLFSALPAKVEAGQSSTLVWFAPGAQTVTLEEVGGVAIDIGSQKENGTVSVTPSHSTSYRLTVDGDASTVTVDVKPVIADFSLDGAPPAAGAMAKLKWTTRGATSLTLTRVGATNALLNETDAARVAAGDFTDTLPADLPADGVVEYTLEATAGAVTVSRGLTVRTAGSLKILSVTAPPYVAPRTQVSVQWKTQGAEGLSVEVDGAPRFTASSAAEVAQGATQLGIGTAPITVTVVATNSRGGRETKSVTVEPTQTVTLASFTVTPGTIAAGGEPVTLTWSAPGARRVRIVEDELLAVAGFDGAAAEAGTATAYPNKARTTYRLVADNTVDPSVFAEAVVTVTAPARFTSADGGATLITGQGNVDLQFVVDGGAELVGFPFGVDDTPDAGTFDDISATGTELVLPNTDNGVATFLPEGFSMHVAGRLVSGPVSAAANGALAFGTTVTAGDSVTTIWPSATYEANYFAPLWVDLDLETTGHVYWQVKGAPPNQVLIVQWDKLARWGAANTEATFQARLHQSGLVEYDYAKVELGASAPTFISGMNGPRGIGLRSTVLPTTGLRRVLFGPKAGVIADFPAAQAELLRNVGFVKMPMGLMAVEFEDYARTSELSISEVMYAPAAGAADAGQWFEVINRSPRPVELQGWTIEFGPPDAGNVHTIGSSLVVPPFGVKVLGQTADTAANDGVPVDYAWGTAQELARTSGAVALRRDTLTLSASWTTAIAGVATVFDPNPVIPAGTGTLGPKTCNATQPYGALAPQQQGSPGVDRTCLGYRLTRVDPTFKDISRTGTPLAFMAGLASLTFASPVPLWGTPTAAVTISQHGWMIPGSYTGAETSTNKTRPSTTAPTGGTIAPFWDSLAPATEPGAAVYTQRFDAGDDPVTPAAHTVIQWYQYVALSTLDRLNFEVKIFDDGTIEFHYASMESGSSSNYGAGVGATAWLENPGATAAIALGINTTWLRPGVNLSYRFRLDPP
ncbi:MAG: lamin tail domain-containing protein [Myxococcales bacterium]|nr:lamin tail domain-containing protein [Myxococcales bacterium]